MCQRKVVGLSNTGLRVGHLEAILSNLETSRLHSLTLAGLNLTEVEDPLDLVPLSLSPGGASLVPSNRSPHQLPLSRQLHPSRGAAAGPDAGRPLVRLPGQPRPHRLQLRRGRGTTLGRRCCSTFFPLTHCSQTRCQAHLFLASGKIFLFGGKQLDCSGSLPPIFSPGPSLPCHPRPLLHPDQLAGKVTTTVIIPHTHAHNCEFWPYLHILLSIHIGDMTIYADIYGF